MSTSNDDSIPAMPFLEEMMGGPLTIGRAIRAFRETEGLSQTQTAELLDVHPQNLSAIERGARAVSVASAVRFARALEVGEELFAQLALQRLLDDTGLKLRVHLRAV